MTKTTKTKQNLLIVILVLFASSLAEVATYQKKNGMIVGSGTGLELFGHVSGSGTLSETKLFGNLNIGNSPGSITLENVVMTSSATTTFAVTDTDRCNRPRPQNV